LTNKAPSTPLDHPHAARPHRVYLALTNRCNRRCPWCSTYSTPERTTLFDPARLDEILPAGGGAFELQLEGGEPTLHPDFWSIVNSARANPRCARLVLCTNGVVLPHGRPRLDDWLARLGAPLTLKLSINHHLLAEDPGLLALATATRDALRDLGGDRLFVVNVRLRRGVENDDERVRRAVEEAGLLPHANVFFLQRYGFASDEATWEPPFLAGHNFRLVNPDGATFTATDDGQVLVARSEAMRLLP
jgi:MoaA/NifB/PqqE/SkfB family radical SAM enzyme